MKQAFFLTRQTQIKFGWLIFTFSWYQSLVNNVSCIILQLTVMVYFTVKNVLPHYKCF